ncbi:sugar phosphate isomerase/epimerase family protein [Galbibacter mesophilus]|uniref:sugar phosphate isomerase/epimerase family protein n=1 Tax=Galbibacter mesophilus TaxID=379069 RepID=UPI00191DDA34|nr:sugar phosphate isomerase/epimerase [Galbibacter mesophilus]MCM5663090.1 sugar phosphate isomerase/epimerase [Galbibacter mesophilus]
MKYVTSLAVIITFFISYSMASQEIGLQLYSLRNEFKKDVPGTFAKIEKWGITKVEDGNDGTQGYSMEEYKALLKKHNINIVSASASFEELQDSPETVIERTNGYDAKYVVCFWIPHQDTIFTITETEKALKVFNEAGKKLKKEGITLAYHPHGYEFRPYKGETLLDYMIKNAKHFEFEMDVYWFAHPGEDPIEWLRRYPNRFKLMHIKDCEKGIEGNQNGQSDVETNVVLGTGQIDIAGIVEEAEKIGIEYIFIEDESSKSEKQIPLSLEYLKSL